MSRVNSRHYWLPVLYARVICVSLVLCLTCWTSLIVEDRFFSTWQFFLFFSFCFLLFWFFALFAFFTVIVLLLSCSPINAPVSSSFAGALRMINVSGSASSALMPRPLNNANYTEAFSGVRFAQVLPRVRKIYCDFLLKSSARIIPTDCSYPILMRRSDPHISRQPTETNCKDHKSDMMLTFVVVIKISGFRALGWQTRIMRIPAQSHI